MTSVFFLRVVLVVKLGNAEIQDFGITIIVHENIVRLDIAVNYLVAMCIGESLEKLNDDVNLVVMIQFHRLHGITQPNTFHIFHDEVGHAVLIDAPIYHVNDIGMIESGDNKRLVKRPGLRLAPLMCQGNE